MGKSKYMVLHFSDNWVFNPSIHYFETLTEAELHIKEFRGSARYHDHDTVYLAQLLKEGVTEILDETENGKTVCGFKNLFQKE